MRPSFVSQLFRPSLFRRSRADRTRGHTPEYSVVCGSFHRHGDGNLDFAPRFTSTMCRKNSLRRLFSYRSFNPNEKPRRSPYVVLGLSNRHNRTAIPEHEIKTAFRKLAKMYHPDLNPDNRPLEECEALMSELVEAYERLMNEDEDDFLENIRVGSSNKVALACELYSVEELILDRFHEVHTLRIEYDDDETNGINADKENDGENTTAEVTSSSLPLATASFTVPIQAHPGDSIMDLKERLESEFGEGWGLNNSLGWELLKNKPALTRTKKNGENSSSENKEDPSTIAAYNEVLSYHLFLDDYEIEHGDKLYAVVRKNDN